MNAGERSADVPEAAPSILIEGTISEHHQVAREPSKVHLGMTAEQVLPLVEGGIIRMNTVLPPDVPDDDGPHRANLSSKRDGTFNWLGGAKAGSRKVSERQALMLTKQKISDGWRWICDP